MFLPSWHADRCAYPTNPGLRFCGGRRNEAGRHQALPPTFTFQSCSHIIVISVLDFVSREWQLNASTARHLRCSSIWRFFDSLQGSLAGRSGTVDLYTLLL